MGRPPSNGGPTFRFNQAEVGEMEAILQAHNTAMPAREVLVALAEKFSGSAERNGKITVQMKQVWNWFQNRRYAIRAKAARAPGSSTVPPMPRDDSATMINVPQAAQPPPAPSATVRSVAQAPQHVPAPSVQSAGKNGSDNSQMEFEAKSARDGAWYDVASFLSHRYLETGDPEVLVRFAGFGPEEDEWVNIRKLVRQRSLPCESSECVAVLPGDLILCFQEGKEQALYFDAHVLDAQRRRHDVRGCRCRFLVRYDHDQSEEIVPLRKVCRRPETDYRLQQLHAENMSTTMNQQKPSTEPPIGNTLRVYPPAEATQKQHKNEERTDAAAMMPAARTTVPAAVDTKVQQPKVAEVVGATKPGNTNAPKDIVAEVVSATNSGYMYVPTGKVVSVSANNAGNPNLPPNIVGNPNVSPDKGVKVVGASNMGNPNVAAVVSASNAVNPEDPPDNVVMVSGGATNTISGGSGEEMQQG